MEWVVTYLYKLARLLVVLYRGWRRAPLRWLVLLGAVAMVYAAHQELTMEPNDVTVLIGSSITLPCRVKNRKGLVQWIKNGQALGIRAAIPRYTMVGSVEEGDFSLEIVQVRFEDEGMFQCQVGIYDEGQRSLRSRIAQLTVLNPTDPPIILQGGYYSTIEDHIILIECIVPGGKPPADITWLDHRRKVIRDNTTYTVDPPIDGYKYTARSVLTIIPKKEHHNHTFFCQSQNNADRTYKETSITIEVKYAPKVQLKVKSGNKGKIPEGQDAVVACLADANPKNMTYKWYKNDKILVGENGTELKISNVTRNYNDVFIKCEVQNEVGNSEEMKTLEVTYPPSFRHLPKDVEADPGTSATLNCDVDAYPQPNITWLHHDEDQEIAVGKTPNLTLTAGTHTAGRYICKAKVEGYPEIEAEAALLIKGSPHILSNSTQYGTRGETVTIDCLVYTVPKAKSIVWTFNGKEIDTMLDQDYAAYEDVQALGVINSTLVIRDSERKHFGMYTCNVTNDYGTDTMEIYLKADNLLPPLFILIGATSGTLVIAVIIMVVIICQRQGQQQAPKPQREAEKPDVTVTGNASTEGVVVFRKGERPALQMEGRGNGNCEGDYLNTGSDSTLCSSAKLGSGIPLAGSIPLATMGQGSRHQYRYSNDYTDPAYMDGYKSYGSAGYSTYVHYGHEYTPGSLRVQTPTFRDEEITSDKILSNLQSVETTSVAQIHPISGSQSNSLKKPGKDALNSLGLPTATEVPPLANGGIRKGGVDIRYAATYKNPHLKNYSAYTMINTAKPSVTPAPPPYPSIRSSVVMGSGSSHSIISPSGLANHNGSSPIATSSKHSDDSVRFAIGDNLSHTPGAHYITMAPSKRVTTNAIVTKKGNGAMATHV